MGTKFQNGWLKKEDLNKTIVSKYLEKVENDLYKSYCKICQVYLNTKSGFCKILDHSKTQKHKQSLFKLKTSQTQIQVVQESVEVEGSSMNLIENIDNKNNSFVNQMKPVKSANLIYSLSDESLKVTRAEVLWCLEMVSKKQSFRSCNGKKQLFSCMFPGEISNSYSLAATKASYIVTEAIGPYFHDEIIKELKVEETYVSLQFDEFTNSKNKKELGIRVQYWSSKQDKIVNKHLLTIFIDNGKADCIFKSLLKALDNNGIALRQILSLGMDGPKVNQKVFRLFQEEKKEKKLKSLINIGSCPLHVVNNTFCKGLENLSIDVSDLIIKVYYYFKRSELRWSEFCDIQKNEKLPSHKFIKHTSTRWLTISPAAERVLEQLKALRTYFLTYLPKDKPKDCKKQAYIDIVKYLNMPLLESTLEFTIYISKYFNKVFTCTMQRDEPLIHIVYVQLKQIILFLAGNVLKKTKSEKNEKETQDDSLENEKEKNDSFILNDALIECLSDKTSFLEIPNCGEKTKICFLKLKDIDKKNFFKEVFEFHTTCITYLLSWVLSREVLKYFQCLVPENIKDSCSTEYVVKLANELPIENIDISLLSVEWSILQGEDKISFVLDNNERIDSFWSKIFNIKFNSNYKYSEITRVVKAALSLIHGSSQVEREFSESGLFLSEDKTQMSERTLNALINVSDGLKDYNNCSYLVPLTNDLIKRTKNAHSSYKNYLDLELKKKENEMQDDEILELNKNLTEKINVEIKSVYTLEKDLKKSKEIYEEALKNSESAQDLLLNSLTNQASSETIKKLMDRLKKNRSDANKKKKIYENQREKIDKKKNNIIKNDFRKRLKS